MIEPQTILTFTVKAFVHEQDGFYWPGVDSGFEGGNVLRNCVVYILRCADHRSARIIAEWLAEEIVGEMSRQTIEAWKQRAASTPL